MRCKKLSVASLWKGRVLVREIQSLNLFPKFRFDTVVYVSSRLISISYCLLTKCTKSIQFEALLSSDKTSIEIGVQ